MTRLHASFVAVLAMVAGLLVPLATANANGEFEGRDLLYRMHVDAVHIAWTGDGLDIKVKQGYDTIREAADVAVRLGPDADQDGNEVSRIRVPDSPAYAFMGEPGDIVWHAPQRLYQGWPPVWAGIGHGELPDGLTDLRLELVDSGGPGDIEVYTTTGLAGEPERALSSKDEEFSTFTPGSHGHYSWIFTEPGVYRTQWKATAVVDGESVESDVVTVPWLVGTDEQVGLPAGTTEGAPILNPVDGDPTPTPTPTVSDTPTPTPTESPIDHEFSDNLTKELRFCTPIANGHLDLNTVYEGETWLRLLQDTPAGKEPVGYNGGVLEVSDIAQQDIPDGAVAADLKAALGGASMAWELPETQNPDLPWPGFSTEQFDYSNVERFTYSVSDTVTPDGGAWALGGFDPVKQKFAVQIDSTNFGEQVIDMPQSTHMHTGFYFSQPGFYTLTFRAEVTPKDPDQMAEWQRAGQVQVHFAVSDEAIAFACDRNGEDLPESPSPTPSETTTASATPSDSAEPTESGKPTQTETASPQPSTPAEESPTPTQSPTSAVGATPSAGGEPGTLPMGHAADISGVGLPSTGH